jgi:serine/threonine-protein kinase
MSVNDDPKPSAQRLALLRAVVGREVAVRDSSHEPVAAASENYMQAAKPAGVPRPEAASLVGRKLAKKYLLKRLLGEGGMGAVYEGVHVEIGKRVAVKLITDEGDSTGEVAARFKREAQAANAARSDHLVEVFDVGRDAELGLYMVLEFLEGEDLETRLLRDKRLDVGLAVLIAIQVSRGLAKAHAAGVVHRDLKPANIFLTTREDGSLLAKIVDFGISKFVNEERPNTSWRPPSPEKRKLTRVGGVIGTPQYMSPEQARGLPNVSHRSDVWSLGAVIYETLAGRPAYEEQESYEDMLIAIVTTDPPSLSEIAPWVPPELAAVVHACLVKDPLARMADCVALQQALLTAVPNLPDASAGGVPVSMSADQLVASTRGSALPEVKASRGLTMSGVSNTQRDSVAPKGVARMSVLPGSIAGVSKRVVRASLLAATVLCIVGALAIGRMTGRAPEHTAFVPPSLPTTAPATAPVDPAQVPATAAPSVAPPPPASAPVPAASASATPSASAVAQATPPAATPPRPKHTPRPAAPKSADPPAHKFGDIKVSDQY